MTKYRNNSPKTGEAPAKKYQPTLLGKWMFLLLLFTLPLFGCGEVEQETNKSTLERIKSTGVVRVGYANEAPYAYLESASGRLTGEAPLILREVMQRMGVNQVEAVLTEFGSLIPGLKAGRFDVIAAGMYITPSRCREIAFSEPTYGIGEAFMVRAGNPQRLHSYEDIANNPDARLGVVAGTVERGYARTIGISDEQVSILPDNPSAVAALQAGRIDAFAGTALTVQDLLKKMQSGKLERANPFADPVIEGKVLRGHGAFGFRKTDSALRDQFNAHLTDLIGSAEHRSLVEPFGFTEAELPGGIKTQQLCNL